MASDFDVRGVALGTDSVQDDDLGLLYGNDFAAYGERAAVRLQPSGRGSGPQVRLEGDDDDVLEIRTADGAVIFQRAGSLARALPETRGDATQALSRGAERVSAEPVSEVRRYRAVPPREVAEAIGTLNDLLPDAIDRDPLTISPAAAGLRVLGPLLVEPAARKAARTLAEWIERPAADDDPSAVRRRKPKKPGLYRVGERLELEPPDRLTAPPDSSGDEPWLLLVHGTFSHTEGAFSQFRGTAEWQSLCDRFEGRVLALEHQSLSRTPAENACDVAHLLPGGARLSVVSHSRGGLVGEVMSLAAVREPDLTAYRARHVEHPDLVALPRLRAELARRDVHVTRFARVASPSGGTTLASRRLDAYASVLLYTFQLVPVLRDTGVAALVRKFLLAVLENRTDPRVIPGIEAMMPESPLIAMLNTGRDRLADGLGSIAGDAEGSGIARRVFVWLADRFYADANDFVVDTPSMTQGLPRDGALVARFAGSNVSHSAYFSNPESRRAVTQWLSTDQPTVSGFAPVVPQVRRRRRGLFRSGETAAGQPRILLVPDALGSTVTEQAGAGAEPEPIWPSRTAVAACGVRGVLDPDRGRVDSLVPAYDPLADALSEGATVIDVPWDARRPLAEALDAVAGRLQQAAADPGGGPVHVVAHGAGALVVLLARLRTEVEVEWGRVHEGGGRCVLLSPPLRGSWAAQVRLDGEDELSHALALVDPSCDPAMLRGLWQACPGVAMLSPDEATGPAWAPLAEQPREWWSGITAVFGWGVPTPSGRAANAELVTGPGDGHVSLGAGHPAALRARYTLGSAWTMLSDPPVAAAVRDLLAGGEPPSLLSAPPAAAADEPVPWRSPGGRLLFPSDEDLVRAALHGSTAPQQAGPALRVGVLHGDLTEIDIPVLIGAYDGTPIAGASARVNRRLDGALERRAALGLYPGPPGTVVPFFDADGKPRAVVIGIGDSGDVTPGRLATVVTQAVLRLVADVLDREPAGHPLLRLTIGSVLIATSGPAALSIQSSVTAIVNGVLRANRRLRDMGQQATVEALQIVELYEELAIEAVHVLGTLSDKIVSAEPLAVERRLRTGPGNRSGQPTRDYHEDEWRTVKVSAMPQPAGAGADDGLTALSFTSLGRAARAEQEVTLSQRQLIDRLVADGITRTTVQRQLYNTLYELLLPPTMKSQGRERNHLMYVVDKDTAALPLELLATRGYDEEPVPIAVDVGVIRRLETSTFRLSTRTASGNAALVIGNPMTGDLPSLPGAATEARGVAKALRALGFQVRELVRDDADDSSIGPADVLNALFETEYRVLHIAGHGIYRPGQASASGVVIGPDSYLTALEITQMQVVPELVFLNCCHLAGIGDPQAVITSDQDPGWRRDRLAASISRALIDGGVRAVVAAGWAVADDAAARFAQTFYAALGSGHDLGAAALAARKVTYDGFRGRGNTWGAYQVYGPPAYRMFLSRPGAATPQPPVARREFRDRLQAIGRRAADAQDVELRGISQELTRLVEQAESEWLGGDERATVAAVREVLGDYGAAIAGYRDALSRWGARANLRTVERLANVLAKAAADRPGALAEATGLLEGLNASFGPTPERFGLLGSCERRRAQLSQSPPERLAAISRSAQCYRTAYDLHHKETGRANPYTGINYVVMHRLAVLNGAPEDSEPAALLRIVDDCAPPAATPPPTDFWGRVATADAELARGLLAPPLDQDAVDGIAARYEAAFAAQSSRGQRLAIDEHLRIVEALLPDGEADARTALAGLAARLRAWTRD